ncbi:amidohydrolase [Candidatus Woesearchaeota archaeon]|jgi:predicted TIM-barrel fold metal-dependent hydrolase|nr:amidohydrolase [Candidatus Woesearchaeota archaeon]MBT6518281.1 amidohydrolase [Candidatus Woesearchaeota archaeon]MBT7367064.1 amidohydrolase [Candidatus Woesearchaeota archaeon]
MSSTQDVGGVDELVDKLADDLINKSSNGIVNMPDKLIDIHAHTSNYELWGLHTKTATLDDLEKYARQYNIKKIVLMATYFPYKGTGVNNKEMMQRIQGRDLFSFFGSLNVMKDFDKGVSELRELAESKQIAGIKLYPGYQNFNASDEKMFEIYKIADKYGLPVMFHTGELHHCCPRSERKDRELVAQKYPCKGTCYIDDQKHLSQPKQMVGAANKFPNVNFILSHLSNPYFLELCDVMSECPNVYTDISGQFLSASDEDTVEYREELKIEIQQFLELPNGINRVMFGTDFPIQSYKDSIELIKLLNLSSENEEKIFYGNAARLLKLD